MTHAHLNKYDRKTGSRHYHQTDCNEGYGFTSIDSSLKRKYGKSLLDFAWQYLSSSTTRCRHPYDGYICRHHLHGTAYAKQLKKAVKASGIYKRVTVHTFRHSFATNLLMNKSDIRTDQELLRHSDFRTTEIYTNIINQRYAGTQSPVDTLLPIT